MRRTTAAGRPRIVQEDEERPTRREVRTGSSSVACPVLRVAMVWAVVALLLMALPTSALASGSRRAGVTTSEAIGAAASPAGFSQTVSASESEPTVDYGSWREVAEAIERQLDEAVSTYESGNTAGASSDFAAAYNVGYVASNLAIVVSDAIGQDAYQSQQEQFQSIISLSYATGHGSDIKRRVSSLAHYLTRASASLDASGSVANPREYAKARVAKMQAQRQKLDAEKKNKNAGKGNRTWSEVAGEMTPILDRAANAAAQGDGRKGSDLVNEAYYQYYEKLGFEKNVMNAIGGGRVSQVENQFKESRKAMVAGESSQQVARLIDTLKTMLVTDASTLDGGAAGSVNPFTRFITSSFGQAFIILIREGLEAILVVAGIIAYLIKSGNKHMVRHIYWGIVAGLAGSGLLALVFTFLFNGNGPQQEIMEGVAALVAMVLLLWTSSWMLSRSSVESWNAYIKSKTVAAVSAGSLVSLALLSFLAVFREGAETVLFYQAIFTMTSGSRAGIWGGFCAAAVCLVVIFLLIRYTSVKIPIRPFFVITSALMAVLVVIFAGGGVHALIEGDLVDGRYLPSVPTNDWLGLYPYAETLIAQLLAACAVVALAVMSVVRQRRSAERPASSDSSGDRPTDPGARAGAAAIDAPRPSREPEPTVGRERGGDCP